MTPRVRLAWEVALKDENTRIVFADILARTGVFAPTKDPELRVLQQFGLELLGTANLYTNKGSFPLDFVDLLTGRSGQNPSTPWSRFWGWLAPRRSKA